MKLKGQKVYSTKEGAVTKKKRRRIGEMPDHLRNELKKLAPSEKAALLIAAGMAALNA